MNEETLVNRKLGAPGKKIEGAKRRGIQIEMQEIRTGQTKTKTLAALKKKYGL